MGAAVHCATNGDDQGFEIWDEWSYADGDCVGCYDVPDQERVWRSFGRYSGKPVGLGTIIYEAKKYDWKRPGSADPIFSPDEFTVEAWLGEDIPPPDFLLGEVLSTTTRALLVAPTGLGKTNFSMALGFATAQGEDFLHWSGSGKPRRVLIIDGEMSRRLMKRRLEDATRRAGGVPQNLFVLNREKCPNMPPLNTEAGQSYIDKFVEAIGGVDLIIFDNIQALTDGNMSESESWAPVLNWAKKLTGQEIGQLWVHHTGYDKSHGYGTNTREWQLDLVALMTAVDKPGADIAFNLTFTKARERAPENRADFDPVIINLAGDQWAYERETATLIRVPKSFTRAQEAALIILDKLIAEGENTETQWRDTCVGGRDVSQAAERESRRRGFNKVRGELFHGGFIKFRDSKAWRKDEFFDE